MAKRSRTYVLSRSLAVAALLLAAPASADVRDGVDAWARGDYAAAVAAWQGPAEAGDPDAMFNLGQAYRLGRGVPVDMARAEELYEAAAQAGHLQAADTYGLMLFQSGRREEALPLVLEASGRGDPRAHYLLGVGHFNGDLLERDWQRAYALMTLANAAGLPQAATAITEMDRHIPLEDRQAAASLARAIETDTMQTRAAQLAAADLAVSGEAPVPSAPPPARQAPPPVQTVAVSPSVAAARDAVLQARQATGTADPAEAGASFARRSSPARPARQEPARAAAATPAPPARAATAARDLSSGPWKVQLGAFGVAGNAERLWSRLADRPEIAGRARLLVPSGRVTRLLAGGYASEAEAQAACNSLRRAGQECLVTCN
ncbi:SPOR domain-containing protein [Aurantiacibacter gangjinensis]|uniref:Sporulation protein n=1 Tax=Aurantiacibacter gangjinensis TaxID=502682 RepID=A0A0G9MSQ5_9SPHN|nr:SPOR domain-containing protein [Aurantiacibacter gangjinensis]KLE33746.1 sporulation protein [Aurantiacibacter gangjinensis]